MVSVGIFRIYLFGTLSPFSTIWLSEPDNHESPSQLDEAVAIHLTLCLCYHLSPQPRVVAVAALQLWVVHTQISNCQKEMQQTNIYSSRVINHRDRVLGHFAVSRLHHDAIRCIQRPSP